MSRNLKELIREMTLEEKAGLCSGADFWNTMGIERLGIPSAMMTDGPHGLRKQEGAADHLGLNKSVNAVCFPAACATASSFDVELMERMGQILGDDGADLPVFHVRHHLLEAGAVEAASGIAIIHIKAGVGEAVLPCIPLQDIPLVLDAVGLSVRPVILTETAVQGGDLILV